MFRAFGRLSLAVLMVFTSHRGVTEKFSTTAGRKLELTGNQ